MAGAVIPSAPKFLVIGGYGAVGRIVCQRLAETVPGQVIAAGRRFEAAASFASTSGGRIRGRALDVRDSADLYDAVSEAEVVVVCIEESNQQIAEACIRHRAHFVDVSASYSILSSLETLHIEATDGAITGVLSVGLAPGITNLLAHQAHEAIGGAHSAEITLLLGLGDIHGPDALRWTLENGRTLSEPKRVQLPHPYGTRTTYRFAFSDQFVVRRTLGIQRVTTRLCLDPPFATSLLAISKAAGILELIRRTRAVKPLAQLLSRVRFGSDAFVAQVTAQGQRGAARTWIKGRNQSVATAAVAACVAQRLATGQLPPGIMHIEQAFRPEEIWHVLRSSGFSIGVATHAQALD